jgi:hypothetical protein
MEYHPLANIFPLMEGAAFDALVADIKANGVLDPLVMFEEQLLDGRNRWRAAEAAGIKITGRDLRQFDPKKDGDPLAWVISKNLQRRHLDESQRADVAAQVANMPQGARTDLTPIGLKSQADAAKALNVSLRSLTRAAAVRKNKNTTPELQRAVVQGHLTVNLAARAVKLSKDQQRKVAEKAATGKVTALLRKIAKEEDEARILSLAPVTGKFPTLVIDPPWDYEWLSLAGPAAGPIRNQRMLDWGPDLVVAFAGGKGTADMVRRARCRRRGYRTMTLHSEKGASMRRARLATR